MRRGRKVTISSNHICVPTQPDGYRHGYRSQPRFARASVQIDRNGPFATALSVLPRARVPHRIVRHGRRALVSVFRVALGDGQRSVRTTTDVLEVATKEPWSTEDSSGIWGFESEKRMGHSRLMCCLLSHREDERPVVNEKTLRWICGAKTERKRGPSAGLGKTWQILELQKKFKITTSCVGSHSCHPIYQ
jgi:hypothetical protein